MAEISPRTGAPSTEGTGTIDFPSKLATPSSVPTHSTPSGLWAIATTEDCGSPLQLDLLRVRKDRAGVHSSAPAREAARASTNAQTRALRWGMGTGEV